MAIHLEHLHSFRASPLIMMASLADQRLDREKSGMLFIVYSLCDKAIIYLILDHGHDQVMPRVWCLTENRVFFLPLSLHG